MAKNAATTNGSSRTEPRAAALSGPPGLNPRQREAVEYCSGPILVIAGPGTGKTRVITEKVLYLIENQGLSPGSILALTFTEKAAQEMSDRIHSRLAEAGIRGQPVIDTFHGFCFKLVQEHAPRLGFRAPLRLLNGPLFVQFIVDHLGELVTEHTDLVHRTHLVSQALARFVSRCHDEALAEQDLAARARAWVESLPEKDRQAAWPVVDMAASVPKLLELQYRRNVVTYGDLLTLARRLVRDDAEVRERLAQQFQYVLVDELQDNNRAQFGLVADIAGRHRRVLAVGDEDQCIYRFRGASLGLLNEFREYWSRDLKVVALEENYRSTEPILDVCTELIRHNSDRTVGKALRPVNRTTAGGRPDVVLTRFTDEADERQFLVREIEARIAGGRRPGDIAILCRSLSHVAGLVEHLRDRGLAVEVVNEGGMFRNVVTRELEAWLRALARPDEDEVALYKVLRLQSFGLSFADQRALAHEARATHTPTLVIIERLAEDPAATVSGMSASGLKRLRGIVEVFRHVRTEAGAETCTDLVGLLQELLRFTGLHLRLDVGTPRGRVDLAAVRGLLLAAEQYHLYYPAPTLEGFLRYLELLRQVEHDDALGTPTDDPQTVKVMTVHQAKGREFPVVVVAGLAHRFPSQNRREMHEKFLDALTLGDQDVRAVHRDEERRVLYVALSRAREELILTLYTHREGSRVHGPETFVEELAKATALKVLDGESGAGDGRAPTTALPSVPAKPLSRRAIEARLHYLISHLGVRLQAREISESILEVVRLYAGLLAECAEGGAAIVQDVLAELGLPKDLELPAPAPEPLAGPSGPLRLSPSSLRSYADCPRMFYYQYVAHIPESKRREARLGTAIHRALEEFHRRHGSVGVKNRDELLGLFEQGLADVSFDSEEERGQAVARGRDILSRYLEEEAERAAGIARVEVERDFRIPLGDDVTLEGRMDRVDELTDGRVRVVDYKTGELKSKPQLLADFQIPSYALAVTEALGRELESIEVIGLRNLKELKKGRVVERQVLRWGDGCSHALTPERLEQLKAQIREAVAGIRSGQFDPRPTEKVCGWCSYNLLCDHAWGVVTT
jgi:DNA helicase-2/ATP-dependent DNA helicase PcrA